MTSRKRPNECACAFRISAPSLSRNPFTTRSEEHTSELQSHSDLVCRLLLEKKKKKKINQRQKEKNKKQQKEINTYTQNNITSKQQTSQNITATAHRYALTASTSWCNTVNLR